MLAGNFTFSFLIVLLILLPSCDDLPLQADGSQKQAHKEGAVTGQAFSVELPCFSCHSRKRFNDPAVFPHGAHKEMGLHCNQCHIIKSHETLSLNGDTCNNCHNLTLMRLSLTEMPAVFNHKSHADMFGCGDCHKDTFRMKIDSIKITMDGIYKGNFCGKCHNGRSAFSSTNCDRCHKTAS